MDVFLDTNVVLDFVLKREPFASKAAIIFDLGERQRLNLHLSSLSMNTIDYVVSKVSSSRKSRTVIIKLLSIVEVLPVQKSTIEQAAFSDFKDFEDAVQNFCAAEHQLQHLITRNSKDFKKSQLSVQTPTEFLATFGLG